MNTRINSFVLGMLSGAGILVTGLALGGFAPAPHSTAEPVTTTRLEIVDELGTPVLVVGSNEHGGSISIRDRFGSTLALIGATPTGASIVMRDAKTETNTAVLQADAGIGGGLHLFDAAGNPAVIARAGDDHALRVLGTNDDPLVTLGRNARGDGRLAIAGADGDPIHQASANADHHGTWFVFDADGNATLATGMIDTGPLFQIYNRFGEPVVMLESNENGAGEVNIQDRDGTGRRISAR